MIKVLDETTKKPLSLIGAMAGCCWGTPTDNEEKNQKRALSCISDGHGRVEEFPDVYVIIDGYSAKCLRELYTHIGGAPTRLQASTRYIDYEKGFNTVVPPAVRNNAEATKIWEDTIAAIQNGMTKLKELSVPKEDYTNLLPLAYESKMVWKVNLRTLVNFMNMRLCSRAYHEIRSLANTLKAELSNYSPEWKIITDKLFVPRCEAFGYCVEKQCCGHRPPKAAVIKEE